MFFWIVVCVTVRFLDLNRPDRHEDAFKCGSFNDSQSLLVSFSFRMHTYVYKYWSILCVFFHSSFCFSLVLKSGFFGSWLYFIRSSHNDPDIMKFPPIFRMARETLNYQHTNVAFKMPNFFLFIIHISFVCSHFYLRLLFCLLVCSRWIIVWLENDLESWEPSYTCAPLFFNFKSNERSKKNERNDEKQMNCTKQFCSILIWQRPLLFNGLFVSQKS